MLYRFQIELSDVDRANYQSLDFRISQHPSETPPYLLCRVLAYALSYQEGLEFSPSGLSDPEAPALKANGKHDEVEIWIEIGNPSAKKLHKATKNAARVRVYTYKNPEVLIDEIQKNNVHRAQDIEIFSFEPLFLKQLEDQLQKNNHWSILHQQGHLEIDANGVSVASDLKKSH